MAQETPSSSNGINLKERSMFSETIAYLEINCDCEPPNIETVASFSPTGSTSSSVATLGDATSGSASSSDDDISTLSKIEQSLPLLQTTSCENNGDTTTAISAGGYISKHGLELLLTPRCFDDYETMAAEEETDALVEREFRKELIREELETMIRAANDMTDETMEPEAVEALGIAANRVAYLQKYYDVASCQYIYVPSVAYTILDGSLLWEATKHYFGSRSRLEFVTVHAADLRAAIAAEQRRGTLRVESKLPPKDLTEDLDLSDDEDTTSDNDAYTHSQNGLATMVWGISPTHSLSNARSFDGEEKRVSKLGAAARSSSPSFVKRHRSAILLVVMLTIVAVTKTLVLGVDTDFGKSVQCAFKERLHQAHISCTVEMLSSLVDDMKEAAMETSHQVVSASSTALSIVPSSYPVSPVRAFEETDSAALLPILHQKEDEEQQAKKKKLTSNQERGATGQQRGSLKENSKAFSTPRSLKEKTPNSSIRSRRNRRHQPIVANLLY